MYEGDRTTIKLGRMRSNIEETSGIIQGCCISTLLFKLITFTIIEKLNNRAPRYKIGTFEDNPLWLADDAVIIAENTRDLLELMNLLRSIAKDDGLE